MQPRVGRKARTDERLPATAERVRHQRQPDRIGVAQAREVRLQGADQGREALTDLVWRGVVLDELFHTHLKRPPRVAQERRKEARVVDPAQIGVGQRSRHREVKPGQIARRLCRPASRTHRGSLDAALDGRLRPVPLAHGSVERRGAITGTPYTWNRPSSPAPTTPIRWCRAACS